MKNFFFSVVVLCRSQRSALLLLSALLSILDAQAALAQDSPRTAGVYQLSGLTYRVWANNLAARRGRVRVIDRSNRVWYDQTSSARSFGQLLNLSELPDGNYAIVMEIGREERRFDLQLHSTSQRAATVSADQLQPDQRMVSIAPKAPEAEH